MIFQKQFIHNITKNLVYFKNRTVPKRTYLLDLLFDTTALSEGRRKGGREEGRQYGTVEGQAVWDSKRVGSIGQ